MGNRPFEPHTHRLSLGAYFQTVFTSTLFKIPVAMGNEEKKQTQKKHLQGSNPYPENGKLLSH